MWLWGHRLLMISSPTILFCGTRWLPRQPFKQDTTLGGLLRGCNRGGLENRSLTVMVYGPLKAHSWFIHSSSLQQYALPRGKVTRVKLTSHLHLLLKVCYEYDELHLHSKSWCLIKPKGNVTPPVKNLQGIIIYPTVDSWGLKLLDIRTVVTYFPGKISNKCYAQKAEQFHESVLSQSKELFSKLKLFGKQGYRGFNIVWILYQSHKTNKWPKFQHLWILWMYE
jgi:hypothetical protein